MASKTYLHDPRHQSISTFTTKDTSKAKVLEAGTLDFNASASLLRGTATQQLQKQSPAGATRVWQNQDTEPTAGADLRPPFLTATGKFDAHKLPGLVVESKAQPLTAPGVFTAAGTLKRSQAVQGSKAIAAIYSYNDVSPAVNTECVHDAASWANRTSDAWDSTVQKLKTSRHHGAADRVPESALTQGELMMLTSRGTVPSLVHSVDSTPTMRTITRAHDTLRPGAATLAPGGAAADDVRKSSVDAFWARMDGGNTQLTIKDVHRASNSVLGNHAIGGAHNSKLIGGVWRHLPRPVVGQPIYTDFYGAYGDQQASYYGRTWHAVMD